MPINCESFEKMIILRLGKWVCAICEPPQGASILNWPNYDLPKHIFFISSGMIGRGPLRGKNIKGGSGSVFRGVFRGYFRVFSNCSKSHCDTIYFSASIHIWNLFFWLKALYPCTIPGFECHWPQLNLPFLPRRRQSQSSGILNLVKTNLRPKFSRIPLTHLEVVLLAQSCPSMHYLGFRVSMTLVALAFSTSEGSKSNSPFLKLVKINLRPKFSRIPLTHLEVVLLAQSCPSMHYLGF